MNVILLLKRFAIANVLTGVYSLATLFFIALNYIKNPFKNWAPKVKLEPPSRLSDPKFGVHKYIKANNVKLHYVESGDPSRPLMIFIHGFPEFWYSWRYQLVEFQKDYWCIAIDMRGYGDSERPEDVSSYKLPTLAEDIRDLVRQLGREKCIIVSHDWGGLVACRYRDLYPETLQGLVVLGSTAHEAWADALWNNDEQRKMSWYVFLFRMPIVPELMLQTTEIFEKSMLIEGKPTVDLQDIECFKYWFSKQGAFTPPINFYRANFTLQVEKKVHQENIPFLFAHGVNERFLGQKLTENMKEIYKFIEITKVEDSGHFLQQEEPKRKKYELVKSNGCRSKNEKQLILDDPLFVYILSATYRMSLTIQQIILDAKRLAGRLKERETEADALLTETQTAYRQISTMKQYKEEVDTLNEASRERPRGELIASIERESRLMRDVQRENGELRAALEDHRRALELIMSKYRQHTEKRIWESRIDFTSAINEKQQELIRQQAERINEMTSIMYKAVNMDAHGDTRREEELYQRLITENKGLREMLDISRRYGSDKPYPPMEDKDVQTDGPPLSGA
ncbi:unnamed protein product [Leptosia nina]|uniref:AB hydrolase-1 domain-containing protein n=1 Tax=Leptosia nina TaxID=320188 RepID=A0AAV1JUW9_9NEOP